MLEMVPGEEGQPLPRVRQPRHPGLGRRREVGVKRPQNSGVKRGLVLEIEVDGALRHAGALRDLRDTGAVEAGLGEDGLGGVHDGRLHLLDPLAPGLTGPVARAVAQPGSPARIRT
jgi:hypothetical protein